MESTYFPPIESLPRIGVKELCDNFDAILDKVEKENTAYVIVDENGNISHKQVKFLSLTEAGMAFDPDADAE